MFNYLIPHFISQEAVFALSFLRLITASNKAASTKRPPIQGVAFSVSRLSAIRPPVNEPSAAPKA